MKTIAALAAYRLTTMTPDGPCSHQSESWLLSVAPLKFVYVVQPITHCREDCVLTARVPGDGHWAVDSSGSDSGPKRLRMLGFVPDTDYESALTPFSIISTDTFRGHGNDFA
jgi:hypothetical protein